MAYRFQPPQENLLVQTVVNGLYPPLLRIRENVGRIMVDPQEGAFLEELRGRRALILPNHPSETEPSVLVGLARRLGEPFCYVATHEIFHGFDGWLLPQMGAFSIRRGRPDRPALRTATRLLAEQDRKLVLFPEGETHMCNDLILPLHKGAIQIGFWTLERLRALGKPTNLSLVPVVIRYRFAGDARPVLLRGIERLERRLGLPPPPANAAPRDRLLRAGLAVLGGVEREYAVQPPAGASPDERIAALFDYIAERTAHVLHVSVRAAPTVSLTLRALFNAAFDYVDGLEPGTSAYEKRLHERRALTARACLADLWRVQNFMAISEESLRAPLTVERAGEILFRLEKEVYGKPRTRPLRDAFVRIGHPWDLSDDLPAYRASRKTTLAHCTGRLEQQMRALLQASLADGSAPTDFV